MRRPRARPHSRFREVAFIYYPLPEIHPMRPVERVLERAKRAGVVSEWRTSRQGQSWYFAGKPGEAMRALRREVFALLGGPGHCLTAAEFDALDEATYRRMRGWA